MASSAPPLIGNPSAQLDLPEGLTRALIDLVRDLDFGALPEPVRRRARHSLTDTLGVIALGATTDPARMLRRAVLGPPVAPGADGAATVFGPDPAGAHPLDAALANGLAGHIRDFDDAGAGGHISAIIVPAALALAESRGASGADVMSALVAGYETAFRVNHLLTDSHYYIGFHSSGTVGTFAAAAAGCRLLRLDPGQWSMAFGIAGSLAGGLLASFGSMTKPLHSGHAARSGLLAALLASEGFTGSDRVLEHEAGFARTHTLRSDAAAALAPLGEPWALAGMIYKFNASCSGTHSGGDGIRALVREHGFSAADVAAITIRVPRIQTEVANIQWPQTVEQAKFSIRFVAAAALLGINTAEAFPHRDSQVADPEVQAAIGLVTVLPLDGVDHGGAADIEVVLKAGPVLAASVNSIRPIEDADAEQAAIEDKFRRTAGTLWPPGAVAAAARRLARFEDEPSVRSFLADLSGSALAGTASASTASVDTASASTADA
ncbi:MAG TPA: MmgE/PrpD family protein [Trebonia sp.]|nr:MmgE/PrpD family protein [Trebonia sp.]